MAFFVSSPAAPGVRVGASTSGRRRRSTGATFGGLILLARVTALTVVLAASALYAPSADAQSGATYGQFARLGEHVAGQLWTNGQHIASQWTTNPDETTAGASNISWGDPAAWPPPGSERFERSGDWVMLPGWGESTQPRGPGAWYQQVILAESRGSRQCTDMRPIPSDPGGRQHYVLWNIPTQPYCLMSDGLIVEYSDGVPTGVEFRFTHIQVWHPVFRCSNPTHRTLRPCIRVWERWLDRNPALGGLLAGDEPTLRSSRNHYLSNGLAFAIDQPYPPLAGGAQWRAWRVPSVWRYQ